MSAVPGGSGSAAECNTAGGCQRRSHATGNRSAHRRAAGARERLRHRLVTTLAAALAIVATVLAAIGLYAMLSFTVTQRTREIGLRLALGAGPRQLRHMVLIQVAWMGIVGGVVGLVAALALGRTAAGLLFGLKATHAPACFGATAVLVLVVAAAAYLPARRASRIDPVVALRAE